MKEGNFVGKMWLKICTSLKKYQKFQNFAKFGHAASVLQSQLHACTAVLWEYMQSRGWGVVIINSQWGQIVQNLVWESLINKK